MRYLICELYPNSWLVGKPYLIWLRKRCPSIVQNQQELPRGPTRMKGNVPGKVLSDVTRIRFGLS